MMRWLASPGVPCTNQAAASQHSSAAAESSIQSSQLRFSRLWSFPMDRQNAAVRQKQPPHSSRATFMIRSCSLIRTSSTLVLFLVPLS